MQWLLIICLFVLAGHCVESAVPNQPCPLGQKYRGSKCIPEEDTVLKKSELLSGKECAPGSSWRSQCNTCNCNDDGMAICTRALCEGNERDPIMKCAPDTRWKNDCNTCWCTDGEVICTRMECISITKREEVEVSKVDLHVDAECLPESKWESNCHSCECSESGDAKCVKQNNCNNDHILAEPIHCKPNTTFNRGCNTCVCLENGLGLCTLKDCERSSVPKKSELLSGKECAPGSSWRSQCNTCNCNDDGMAICTQELCVGNERDPIMKCAPDTRWKNDCNTCWCTDGEVDCTKMECIGITNFADEEKNSGTKLITKSELFSNVKRLHRRLNRAIRCNPSEEFQVECNNCKCSQNGQSYKCTQNECLTDDPNSDVDVFVVNDYEDHMEKHIVCKPRDTFYISCNACHCNELGTDYACTNKPCPLPKDVEVFHELNVTKSSKNATKSVVCVANRMFIKDCNTCWCNDDGTSFYCTRRICVPMLPDETESGDPTAEKLREVKKQCKPDEVFELDCNMCRCNPDGKSFSCTRRACVEEDKKNESLSRNVRDLQQAELPKACQPGQEFRMDCNKCLCDNEGHNFSCTRIDCSTINNNHNDRRKREVTQQETKKCVPGSVFHQGCNVCRCTDEGLHATCTLKRCHQENEVDVQSPEQDPGFRCNAGEQFTRDCNDCTCSADGKSIFCTIRFCDQQLSPDI